MLVLFNSEAFPKTWTCSGVLVSDQHVVTAAHCLTNIYRNGCRYIGPKTNYYKIFLTCYIFREPILNNFKIKVGFLNLNDPDIPNQRETFKIKDYHIPNGFNGCSFDLAVQSGRDIAVITLDRKIPESFFYNKFASKVFLFSTQGYKRLDIATLLKVVGYGKGSNAYL